MRKRWTGLAPYKSAHDIPVNDLKMQITIFTGRMAACSQCKWITCCIGASKLKLYLWDQKWWSHSLHARQTQTTCTEQYKCFVLYHTCCHHILIWKLSSHMYVCWWVIHSYPVSIMWHICHQIYTPCPEKNGPPKHVKITFWIENDSRYFSLYHEKPSICNVCVKFHDNQPVHCWDIAFHKKMVESCRRQHCQ